MARRLETLDSLRGLAALAVVFGHCLRVFPEFGDRPYHGPASWLGVLLKRTPLSVFVDGHPAVLIFFVLSGLVLSLPFLESRAPAYTVFAAKRMARLYPPYIVAVLIAALLQARFAAEVPHTQSAWLLQGNWTETLTARTALDYMFMLGRNITVDNPVWSLDYEMRISLVLPLLVLPMRRLGALAGAAASGTALLAVAVLLLNVPGPDAVHAVGQTCLYGAMFMLGAGLASQVDRLQAIRRPSVPWLLAVVAWMIFFLCWRDAMLAIGAGALIAAVLMPGPMARFCMQPPVRFLGRISYSLYLVHVPLLLTMLAVLHGIIDTRLVVSLFLPVALAGASLFYVTVELPSHRLARAIGRQR